MLINNLFLCPAEMLVEFFPSLLGLLPSKWVLRRRSKVVLDWGRNPEGFKPRTLWQQGSRVTSWPSVTEPSALLGRPLLVLSICFNQFLWLPGDGASQEVMSLISAAVITTGGAVLRGGRLQGEMCPLIGWSLLVGGPWRPPLSRRLFLHSVVSALLGVCLVLVFASYVFIQFFLDPAKLRSDQHFLGKTWPLTRK